MTVDEFGDTEEKTGSGAKVSEYLRAGTDQPVVEPESLEPSNDEVVQAQRVIADSIPDIDKTRAELFAAKAKLDRLEASRDAAVKTLEKRNIERDRIDAVRAIQKQTVEASLAAKAKQERIVAALGPDAPREFPSKLDQALAMRPRNAKGQAAYYANKHAEQQAARALVGR